jgi:hypothetical protein
MREWLWLLEAVIMVAAASIIVAVIVVYLEGLDRHHDRW